MPSLRKIFHNHPSRYLFPSQADIDSAENILRIYPQIRFFIYTTVSWPGGIHYRESNGDKIHHTLSSEENEYLQKGILYYKK